MALDYVTITVDKSLDPFKHKLEEIRAILADHPNKEDLIDDRHESMLPNYQQLRDLGPHPLLAHQTKANAPNRWLKIRLEVKGKETTDWIILFVREDSVYVVGFSNKYKSYELVVPTEKPRGEEEHEEEEEKEGQEVNMSHGLLGSGFVQLEWDYAYGVLFNCKTDVELNKKIEEVLADPNFVVDGVSALSEYRHKVGRAKDKEEEARCKIYIAGIAFKLCEWLRMDMETEFMGTLEDGSEKAATAMHKAHIWGIVCHELFNWRGRGFQKWMSSDRRRAESKDAKRLKKGGIFNELFALRLVRLVLNNDEEYYINMDRNKPKPKGLKPKDPGEGSQGKDDVLCQAGGIEVLSGEVSWDEVILAGQGSWNEEVSWDEVILAGQGSWDEVLAVLGPWGDGLLAGQGRQGSTYKREGLQDHGDDGKVVDSQGSVENDGKDYSYGRRRLQIIAVRSTFSIDGINFYDWHRGQPIYRRQKDMVKGNHGHYAVSSTSDIEEGLVLVGPSRAISPYGTVAVNIFPTRELLGRKRKRTTPLIQSAWVVRCLDYDEVTVHRKHIFGEDGWVDILYMVIPSATEARLQVSLQLGHYNGGDGSILRSGRLRGGGYRVSGVIQVRAEGMEEDLFVELLPRRSESFWVPCVKKTRIPIVPMVCLPSENVEIYVHLTLKPWVGPEENLGPYHLKLKAKGSQRIECRNHAIEVSMDTTA